MAKTEADKMDRFDVGAICFAIALLLGVGLGQFTARREVQRDWDESVCLQRFQHARSGAATLAVLKHYPDCFEHLPAESPTP